MDVVLASGGLKIVAHNGRYGVFVANSAGGQKEADWFDTYEKASKLAQDLFVSQATSNDPMIGDRKYCPSGMGNGQTVVVVAKSKNGYIVQPVGTDFRMEVSAEVLSDPMTLDQIASLDKKAEIDAETNTTRMDIDQELENELSSPRFKVGNLVINLEGETVQITGEATRSVDSGRIAYPGKIMEGASVGMQGDFDADDLTEVNG